MENKKKICKTTLEVMFNEAVKNCPFSVKQIALFLDTDEIQIKKWINGEEHIEAVTFEKLMDLLGYPLDAIGKSNYLPRDVDFKNFELSKDDLEAIARVNKIYANVVFNKSL